MRSEKERLIIDRIKKGYGLAPIYQNPTQTNALNVLNRETCNRAYYGICTDGDCNNCPYEGERRTDEGITE